MDQQEVSEDEAALAEAEGLLSLLAGDKAAAECVRLIRAHRDALQRAREERDAARFTLRLLDEQLSGVVEQRDEARAKLAACFGARPSAYMELAAELAEVRRERNLLLARWDEEAPGCG